MSSNRSSKGRASRTLIALAALALAIPMTTGSALAAPASGEVSLSLKTNMAKRIAGKASKGGGAVNVTLPIVDLEMPAAATVRTREIGRAHV